MRLIKLIFVLGALIAPQITPPSAMAYDVNSTAAVNVDRNGVGLRGFDPVAYFRFGAPQKGDSRISAAFAGVTYHFVSEDNRAIFLANPGRYQPQYGGFCETGVSKTKKLNGDPEVWRIAEGKLFVYVNQDAKRYLLQSPVETSARALRVWPDIKDKRPKDL